VQVIHYPFAATCYGEKRQLGRFEDKDGPLPAAFIVGLVRRPELDQARPEALDLGISCLACLVVPAIAPDLKLCDRMGTQIDDPRVCALVSGIDIADDDRVPIAQVEDGDGAILPGVASFGGEEQYIPACTDSREDSPAGATIDPALERGHKVLDCPYTDARST